MRKNIQILLVLMWFLPGFAVGQMWNRRPWDGIIALGTTNFMGDLGGGQGDAAHFLGVKDFDFAATRPVMQGGLRYKFHDRWAVKTDLSLGLLGGDDANSGNEGRKSRNLQFRSIVFEQSLQFEFYFIKEEVSARYRYSSVRGWGNISTYLFAGAGWLYFNPQAQYQGKWYNLQPLGTEGQGIGDNPAKYKRIALSFPVGIGMKYSIDRSWSVGGELSIRYTTSDYIDDVSGSYYNVDAIANAYGPIAAALADRNIDPYNFDENGNPRPYINNDRPNAYAPPRGSPAFNDAYMFITFNLTYRFRYGLLGAFGRSGRAKY